MQRTNSMVLGLIAIFVLGGALVLMSCGGGDNTTDINASNAASQVGSKQFNFTSHPAPPYAAIEHIFSNGILAFQRP